MKLDRAPKTVGQLRRYLEQFSDDTPIMRGRGNMTFEPFSQYAGVVARRISRMNVSKIYIDPDRFPQIKPNGKIKTVVTFG